MSPQEQMAIKKSTNKTGKQKHHGFIQSVWDRKTPNSQNPTINLTA